MSSADVPEQRFFIFTPFDGNGTPGMEPASGRRVDGAGNIAGEYYSLFLGLRVGKRDGGKEHLGVWM